MIADRIARALGGGEERFTLKDVEPWLNTTLFGGPVTRAGQTVSVDGALGLIPVFACIRVLAESIHVMPCHVYRRLDRGRERADDVWQYRLLHESPNPEMAPGQFFETIMVHLNGWGDAFLEKVPEVVAGLPRVRELWPIEPKRVTVERRKTDGTKIFKIDGDSRDYTESTILHIPALGYDGLRGKSPITVAREELGVALARQKWQGNFYRRGANNGAVIERPADAPQWSQKAADMFKAQFSALYEGSDGASAGGTPVLEDGMTLRPVGMPLKDQQFIEQGQFTAGQIANLFRVPPSMIGAPTGDSLTYGNREQDAIQFVTFSLLPWMTRISQALWRDNALFPSRTFYPAFLPEALLKGDSAERAAFYKAMADLHVLTPNDIAEMEDRPIRPGGDEFPTTPAPSGVTDEPTG